jgi:hypothetical protein
VGARSLRSGAAIVLVAMVVGSALLAVAMSLYPGGTELDRAAVGHSFWFNLLCDLTGDSALNGAPNAGRGFARAGMAVFSVGMGAFWMILPAEFPGHRALAATVRLAGAISVLGFLAVLVVTGGAAHAVAVFAAAVPGVLAALVGLGATFRYVRAKVVLLPATGAIVAATVDAILYAQRVSDGFRSCPPALPVFQRLTTLLVFAWAGATSLRVAPPWRSRERRAG